MSKTIVLCALTVAMFTGLSAVGCYLQHLVLAPTQRPFIEELHSVRVDYVQRMEEAWKHLPKGPEREKTMEEWQQQHREEQEEIERAVYEKHGRVYPETVYPGPP